MNTIKSMENASMPGASLVRITAEDYERMAEFICAEIRPFNSTIYDTWGNIEFEYNGWGIYESSSYYPDDVIDTWVECHTVDDEGEEVMNNFRIDTLRAYIDEYIRECDNVSSYPEFSSY